MHRRCDYIPKNLRKLPGNVFESILSYMVVCQLSILISVIFFSILAIEAIAR